MHLAHTYVVHSAYKHNSYNSIAHYMKLYIAYTLHSPQKEVTIFMQRIPYILTLYSIILKR